MRCLRSGLIREPLYYCDEHAKRRHEWDVSHKNEPREDLPA